MINWKVSTFTCDSCKGWHHEVEHLCCISEFLKLFDPIQLISNWKKKQINEAVILNFEFENKDIHTAHVYQKMHIRWGQQVYIVSIINRSSVTFVIVYERWLITKFVQIPITTCTCTSLYDTCFNTKYTSVKTQLPLRDGIMWNPSRRKRMNGSSFLKYYSWIYSN